MTTPAGYDHYYMVHAITTILINSVPSLLGEEVVSCLTERLELLSFSEGFVIAGFEVDAGVEVMDAFALGLFPVDIDVLLIRRARVKKCRGYFLA